MIQTQIFVATWHVLGNLSQEDLPLIETSQNAGLMAVLIHSGFNILPRDTVVRMASIFADDLLVSSQPH